LCYVSSGEFTTKWNANYLLGRIPLILGLKDDIWQKCPKTFRLVVGPVTMQVMLPNRSFAISHFERDFSDLLQKDDPVCSV